MPSEALQLFSQGGTPSTEQDYLVLLVYWLIEAPMLTHNWEALLLRPYQQWDVPRAAVQEETVHTKKWPRRHLTADTKKWLGRHFFEQKIPNTRLLIVS